ncbi:unnamed protein product [Nezara viridula]|uniref:Uncharacterized protein n=1 Tax=Nezara viridula TaxID=85310 RepID=A0A9P0MIU1_NEZVI|nr:unnamed protein product [Nezara viridula]
MGLHTKRYAGNDKKSEHDIRRGPWTTEVSPLINLGRDAVKLHNKPLNGSKAWSDNARNFLLFFHPRHPHPSWTPIILSRDVLTRRSAHIINDRQSSLKRAVAVNPRVTDIGGFYDDGGRKGGPSDLP